MKIPISLVLDTLYIARSHQDSPEEIEAISYAIELVQKDLHKRITKNQTLFVGKEETK